jgi:[protein-PII] uridylyltransferase
MQLLTPDGDSPEEVTLGASDSAPASGDRAASEEEFVRLYLRSMPHGYREAFDQAAIATHAGIVQRRGSSATRVELWRELADGVAAVCVVADDCPGLLSRISAALVAHDFDVVAAQAFCRKRPDAQTEAVDFFWIRRLAPKTGAVVSIRSNDIASFGEMLDALVRGRANFDRAAQLARAHRAAGDSIRVKFESDEQEGHTVLLVEGPDRPGLLYAISEALYRERVQIVRSDVSTRGGRVLDRFYVTELDGARVHRARLLGLQTSILAAIGDSLHRHARREIQEPERHENAKTETED